MNERTTTIVLDGKPRRIYCDNAALLRMEEAGGNIREFDKKPMLTITAFILGNLADQADRETFRTRPAVMNALESLEAATTMVEEIFTGSTFFSPTGEKKSGASGENDTTGQKALSASG